MTSNVTKDIRSWLLFGFVLPILVEVIAAIVIVLAESGASAEGFAGIVVLIMLIIAIPLTLVGNIVIVPRTMTDKLSYIFRGLILPACFLVSTVIYYTGIWDYTMRTYFPAQVEKIVTAGSGPVGDGTFESIFVVNSYTGSSEEQKEIESYAERTYTERTWGNSDYVTLSVQYYFVPREFYDPLDDSVNRAKAVAVFRHMGTDKSETIERVER
jgi:hypothetical protein